MTRPTITYELAMAASKDEANRNMRKHGRTAWNEDDWNVACRTFDRLMPEYILDCRPPQKEA